MTTRKTLTLPARNLHIVVVNPIIDPEDVHDAALGSQLWRGNLLRIGLLESGYNIIAALPADIYLPERMAQLQPDMIIIDAEPGHAIYSRPARAALSAIVARALRPSCSPLRQSPCQCY
ncbi:hypothetical protein AAKU55_003393 [Oxalobacteraceae bacterium GrIS 1.11]